MDNYKESLDKRLLLSADRKNMFYWQSNRPFTEEEIKNIFIQRDKLVNKKEIINAVQYFLDTEGVKNERLLKVEERIKWGSINLVFPFKTNKRNLVIRLHPNKLKNGYFWSEYGINKLVRDNGIECYEVVYVNDDTKDFNFCFFVATLFDGVVGSQAIQESIIKEPDLSFLLGKKVAQVHKIKTEGYGFFDNSLYKNSQKLIGIHDSFDKFFFASLEQELSYLKKVGVVKNSEIDKIKAIFQQSKNLIECKNPVLIHNDVAPWNCILTDDKKDVVLTDWDESFSGDPVMDFAQFNLFYEDENFTKFIEGYKTFTALPENFGDKLKVYRLRYLITKLNLRRKKLEQEEMIREKFELGLKMLRAELS